MYVCLCIQSPPSWASLLLPLPRSSRSTKLTSLCYLAASHQLSILHRIVYVNHYYFLNSSRPLLPPLCPHGHSLFCISIPPLQIRSPATLFILIVFSEPNIVPGTHNTYTIQLLRVELILLYKSFFLHDYLHSYLSNHILNLKSLLKILLIFHHPSFIHSDAGAYLKFPSIAFNLPSSACQNNQQYYYLFSVAEHY